MQPLLKREDRCKESGSSGSKRWSGARGGSSAGRGWSSAAADLGSGGEEARGDSIQQVAARWQIEAADPGLPPSSPSPIATTPSPSLRSGARAAVGVAAALYSGGGQQGSPAASSRRRQWRPTGLGSGLQNFVNVLIFVILECLTHRIPFLAIPLPSPPRPPPPRGSPERNRAEEKKRKGLPRRLRFVARLLPCSIYDYYWFNLACFFSFFRGQKV
ncbi:hypothetical protein DAI22_06g213203 [Oryza sativa Japonica Group]|nr:hypothetical protein DAI22_06g213203 [Oryza sativa Japonica Group]